MDTPTETIYSTPLFEEHVALGAKMVPFGGWNMPLQYESILQEWEYNRRGCSIFDCSHMGEFLIEGDAVTLGLDRIVTQPIVDMPIGSCRYGAICHPQGGVIDDLIVYRRGQESWMIVVNAANIAKDAAHFRAHLKAASAFTDVSFQTAKLDVQGPHSRDVLAPLVPGIQELEYYTFKEYTVLGERCIVSRTGYTGELGFEIYYPWEKAKQLWKTILKDDKVKPTGLGVRDVLRVEMCYSLYGHELDDAITPLQAGLDKFLDWNKAFIGRDALLKIKEQGGYSKVGYFVSASRRSPRAGNELFNSDGTKIGVTTSGTFSPGLGVGIGIGFINPAFLTKGTTISFSDGRSQTPATIVGRPFYKEGTIKN